MKNLNVLAATAILLGAIASQPFKIHAATLESVSSKQVKKSSLVKKLSNSNLEGELYFQDKNSKTNLGKFILAQSPDKEIYEKTLFKQGFFLTVKNIVKDESSFLAIVNQNNIDKKDRTQYLYFSNIMGLTGVFIIKDITAKRIAIEVESASGEKSISYIHKRSGVFLPN